MVQALELAERGLYTTDPNPRVGCVLVRDDRVVGEGWHARAGEPHAEVMALRSAGAAARGATAYVTLEPCSHTGRTPPCADALLAAGVSRVVCATVDPNPKVAGSGIARLEAAGVPVAVGLLAVEARALNVGFFSRFERRRPYIRLKLAMSLDARTTAAAGGQHWITGEASRADVQTWRARSSAVLTGAGTVRVDDPRLDVRLAYGPWVRQPLRVVLDSELSCKASSRVFADGNALVFAAADTAAEAQPAAQPHASAEPQLAARPHTSAEPNPVAHASTESHPPAQSHASAESHPPAQPHAAAVTHVAPLATAHRISVIRVPRAARGLDLHAVLDQLTSLEVNELLVECGPRLAAAFLEADLVDELILYVAPFFLGADAAPLAELRGLGALVAPDAVGSLGKPISPDNSGLPGTPGIGSPGLPRSLSSFEFRDQRLLQNDLRLVLTPKRA
jgi:diaminohydroxyphosphoribosylaminopyrimidine deaminase/5-amino-6-(5-phosphoribosylamino)uracil reductase